LVSIVIGSKNPIKHASKTLLALNSLKGTTAFAENRMISGLIQISSCYSLWYLR